MILAFKIGDVPSESLKTLESTNRERGETDSGTTFSRSVQSSELHMPRPVIPIANTGNRHDIGRSDPSRRRRRRRRCSVS